MINNNLPFTMVHNIHVWCTVTTVLIMLCIGGSCNQMNPHVFPSKGAFFEGWYGRVMDFEQGLSLGWIFSYLQPANKANFSIPKDCPKHSVNGKYPCPVAVTHLVSANHSSKLIASRDLLPEDGYTLTTNGQPIVQNPDDASPAEFEAKMGEHINYIVKPNGTTFSIRVGDALFKGETAFPVPWGPHGEGPESYLEHLPLPLHWFVYSLRSEVKNYEYINHKTGQNFKGGSQLGKPVLIHFEKNWGGAFPMAWIWAEGVNPLNNASFAISSGLLKELFLDIPAQLSGYKNPGKNIDCKFHPLNSEHTLQHDGCQGHAQLVVEGLECKVVFDVAVDPNLLSSCLITPQVDGYKPGCVESYNAVANVTVFQRRGLLMHHTDTQIFKMAAIEFGGSFMCNGKCPS